MIQKLVQHQKFPPNRLFHTHTIRVADLSPELEQTWREIRATKDCYRSPYFDLGFIRAVDRIRGKVEIAVVNDRSGAIIGFFPFRRTSLHRAEPVGGLLNDVHGIMVLDGIELSIEKVMEDCRLARFSFHSMPIESVSEKFIFRKNLSYNIDLSDGWDAYIAWAKQHSSTIKRQPQKSRAMQSLGDIRFEFDCVDESAMNHLIALKRAKYQRSRTFDILGVKWASELLKDIQHVSQSGFQGLLSVIWKDDEMIAAHFGMISGNVLHYWFPTFDNRYHKYSPGTQLILQVAEEASTRGITMIDFGYGDDPYKLKFCNGRQHVACGQVNFNPLAFQFAKQRHYFRNQLKKIPMKSAAKMVVRGVFPEFGHWNFK